MSSKAANAIPAAKQAPAAKLVRLGILLSGRGSNFLAIARAISAGRLQGCEIACIISNKADAPGLEAARDLGLEAIAIPSAGLKRAEHDAAVMQVLRAHRVDLVCLAGYMRVLTREFVDAYAGRMLNVHPSLLPAFPGLDAQAQALAYGAKLAGCTVHFVEEGVDSGAVILQRAVPVLDDDTEETLSARILYEEHLAYPEAIARVISGHYALVGRHFKPRTPSDASVTDARLTD